MEIYIILEKTKVIFYCNDQLVVDSSTLWVLIDSKTQRIQRLPAHWLEQL